LFSFKRRVSQFCGQFVLILCSGTGKTRPKLARLLKM
jgi:hypothetical protein